MFTAITRVELKGATKLPRFFYYTSLINKQLKTSSGLISVKTSRGDGLEFWTLTTWENLKSMQDFARSGAHLKAMKIIGRIAKGTKSMHWETYTIPGWKEAKDKLLSKIDKKYIASPSDLNKN